MITDQEITRLTNSVLSFLQTHRTSVKEISGNAGHVFESMCYVVFARYYEKKGYDLEPTNLFNGKFRFRFSTAGNPWNFSYFNVRRRGRGGRQGKLIFELRHNQKVSGAWASDSDDDNNEALFALDVAVILPNSLPQYELGHRRKDERVWVRNSELITFAEAKGLIAYPMLLAQFLGIVHEITPSFLHIKGRHLSPRIRRQKHPLPTLMTSNHVTSGTSKVLRSFQSRRMRICLLDNVNTTPEADLVQLLEDQCVKALG